jgi:hypothetical protein
MMNQGLAAKISDKQTSMAYLVDDDCPGKDQLKAAHTVLLNRERQVGKYRHTGAMGFDIDDRVSALQAADVISWCARRRQLDGELPNEFAALDEVPRTTQRENHPLTGWGFISTSIFLWTVSTCGRSP